MIPRTHALRIALIAVLAIGAAGSAAWSPPPGDGAAVPPVHAAGIVRPASSIPPGNDSNGSGGPKLPVSVTFLEQGLPPGSSWGIALCGVERTTTSSSLTFGNLTAASCSFSVVAPTGYAPAQPSGSLALGTSQRIAVDFQSDGGGAAPAFGSWPPTTLELELIAIILVVGVGGIGAAELRERRRRARRPPPPEGPDAPTEPRSN